MRTRLKTAEDGQTECEARYEEALGLIETLREEMASLRNDLQTGRVSGVPSTIAEGVKLTLARMEKVRTSDGETR